MQSGFHGTAFGVGAFLGGFLVLDSCLWVILDLVALLWDGTRKALFRYQDCHSCTLDGSTVRLTPGNSIPIIPMFS